MHFRRLPVCHEILGASAATRQLADMLSSVAAEFRYTLPVQGLPFSVRLILTEPFEKSVSFGGPCSAEQVAESLMQSIRLAEVRHHPLPHCSYLINKERGWQVHRLCINGNPSVLASTTWC